MSDVGRDICKYCKNWCEECTCYTLPKDEDEEDETSFEAVYKVSLTLEEVDAIKVILRARGASTKGVDIERYIHNAISAAIGVPVVLLTGQIYIPLDKPTEPPPSIL